MGTSNTFHKEEKLSHKDTIDSIFNKKGSSIFNPPLLFVYLKKELKTPYSCQFFVSVGKRKFKKAVDRNRIKRQITNIYRLQKQRIYQSIKNDDQYAIGVIYLGKELPDHHLLEKKLTLSIDEFIKRIK
ncbi:MAG: Ribonuclease P protein component [Bacteroidia bacterium]|jgi:ribonuclease P protein component|nr:MAG: Ribonuclease P protein component [Bacteroidia bacterium]